MLTIAFNLIFSSPVLKYRQSYCTTLGVGIDSYVSGGTGVSSGSDFSKI